MTVFERIKKLAKEHHMTLVEVNDKAGLGTRTIYHWKTKEPSVNNLASVARVLHTTTDYLKGLTDNPNPSVSNETTDADLERALDNAHSFDGKPMDEHDRQIIKGLLKGYFENKN